MARTFYDSFGYRGGLSTSLRLGNRARLPMPFMNTMFCKPEDFASLDETTTAEQLSSTERLKPSLEESVYQLLAQVCWSYWQGSDEFPSAAVREGLTNRLRAMKLS